MPFFRRELKSEKHGRLCYLLITPSNRSSYVGYVGYGLFHPCPLVFFILQIWQLQKYLINTPYPNIQKKKQCCYWNAENQPTRHCEGMRAAKAMQDGRRDGEAG